MLDATHAKDVLHDALDCEAGWSGEIDAAIARQTRRVIEVAVIRVFDVDGRNFRALQRSDPHAILARQVAMYLAHTSCRMSMAEVGKLYERDRKTVAYSCALIEDRRDDPVFDRALDLLSWAVPYMAARPLAYLADQ